MTSEIIPSSLPARPAKDEAHIWRSKYFDQSARCEARLRRLLASIRPSEPVPHQFKAVAMAAKQAAEAGAAGDKLVAVVEELLPLIELRAYLAHSAMRLMSLNGDHLVAFAHAGGDQEFGQKVMLLNTKQRIHALKKLTNLSDRLKRYLQSTACSEATPPSSPPQPKQASVTGP
jgi:hypothetical protein